MSAQWYVIRSKPNKEEFLWGQLKARSIDVFYPRLRVNPVNPRAKKVKPYFPGYLFIFVDMEEEGSSAFQWLPNSLGLVMYGDKPAMVPENLIVKIRQRVEEIAAAGGFVFESLKSGDQVLIQSGPFSGYDAIFDERISGSERVKVLLAFMNERQLSVELNVGQIEKIRRN
jgi:transcriptional antiterminator RfaH